MKNYFVFILVFFWTPCMASSPLLKGLPPCPAPADLPLQSDFEHPAGGDALAAPADLGGAPPKVNLDIPLGIPVTEFTGQPADLSLSQVPVGSIKLRGSQTEVEVLGRTAFTEIPQTDCIPAAKIP